MIEAAEVACCRGINLHVSVGSPVDSSIWQPPSSVVESISIPRTPAVHLEAMETEKKMYHKSQAIRQMGEIFNSYLQYIDQLLENSLDNLVI